MASSPIEITTPGTNGNAYWWPSPGTDHPIDLPTFRRDVDGTFYGRAYVPDDYSADGAIVLSIAANATSGVTRLQVSYGLAADAENIDPTLTAITAQDVTVPGTALLRKDVTFTPSGLAAGDLLVVKVDHVGSHGNDTLAAETLLVEARLTYTPA